ncbi:MAG: hypothetical protein JWR69_2791 [Pedosphaera sp.]|nr:hypothetical protein [Pedosphaera sp.]
MKTENPSASTLASALASEANRLRGELRERMDRHRRLIERREQILRTFELLNHEPQRKRIHPQRSSSVRQASTSDTTREGSTPVRR